MPGNQPQRAADAPASRRELYVVVGLPGAGKTTRALLLAEQPGAVRFNSDEWMTDLGVDLFDEAFRDRLEQRMLRLTAELLAAGGRVVIEFGSWSRAERDHLPPSAATPAHGSSCTSWTPTPTSCGCGWPNATPAPGRQSSTARPSPATCSTGRHPTPKKLSYYDAHHK